MIETLRRSRLLTGGALVAYLGLSSCSLVQRDQIKRTQCVETSDCDAAAQALGAPLACVDHVCQRPMCEGHQDCALGASCVDNVCVASPGGSGASVACTKDGDCGEERRCGFDGTCYSTWGCLDEPRDWPSSPATVGFSIAVRNIEDLEHPETVGGLVVSGCSVLDPACDRPSIEPEDYSITSDKLVRATFRRVPATGFIGYMTIDVLADDDTDAGVPTVDPQFVPTVLHFPAEVPLVFDFENQTRVFVIRRELYAAIAAATMVELDTEAATIVTRVHDCGGRPVAGISTSATGFPAATFVPLQSEISPVLDSTKTTDEGAGLLINTPGGRGVKFVLRDENTGRVLTDTLSFVTHAGAMNYVFWYPRYSAQQRWMEESRRQGLD